MIATRANMRIARERHGNRVAMLDVVTGQTFSANPDDYFWAADDEIMWADGGEEGGEPCELVVPHSGYYDLDDDGVITRAEV